MCIFEGHGHCNSLAFVIRITEDFNVGFFKLPNKFYVLLMPVNGFHHGYIKALFKTDQSTINIEHYLKKNHRLYLAIACIRLGEQAF